MTAAIRKRSILTIIILSFLLSGIPALLDGKKTGGLKIIDYQKFLNRKFKKRKRISTGYIIIHTSEAGKISTLRTLSGGKRVGKRRTKGGHANYTILRDGKVYRILDHKYRADHTGLSMWNGKKDLSSHSIGIELVGYHYGTITFSQYRSLTPLLKELQGIYKIPDKNILTHSQVSYGKPNLWYKRDHRGRKRCALNFNRSRAGLADRWTYDPDVRAKRLTSDFQTRKVFYSSYTNKMTKVTPENREPAFVAEKTEKKIKEEVVLASNIISKENTAWNIAGEDYKDPETIYILPGGKKVSGDKAGSLIGWGNIPRGTKVILNQSEEKPENGGPVHTIKGSFTAWSFAAKDYKADSTFYFLPEGKIKSGKRIKDWDSLPSGVKMITGYIGPYPLGSTKGKTAWGIAGKDYNSKETIYYIPGTGIVTGDKMSSFTDLPKYSKIFIKRR
ncbi:MAG: peptidoglycan recognition family protein [Acidobacteriota bacterium]